MLKSELSTSVPVAVPIIAVGTINQSTIINLKEREAQVITTTEDVQSEESCSKSGNCIQLFFTHLREKHRVSFLMITVSFPASSPNSSLRSIMKRKAEVKQGSPSTKKNLQFIGINGG